MNNDVDYTEGTRDALQRPCPVDAVPSSSAQLALRCNFLLLSSFLFFSFLAFAATCPSVERIRTRTNTTKTNTMITITHTNTNLVEEKDAPTAAHLEKTSESIRRNDRGWLEKYFWRVEDGEDGWSCDWDGVIPFCCCYSCCSAVAAISLDSFFNFCCWFKQRLTGDAKLESQRRWRQRILKNFPKGRSIESDQTECSRRYEAAMWRNEWSGRWVLLLLLRMLLLPAVAAISFWLSIQAKPHWQRCHGRTVLFTVSLLWMLVVFSWPSLSFFSFACSFLFHTISVGCHCCRHQPYGVIRTHPIPSEFYFPAVAAISFCCWLERSLTDYAAIAFFCFLSLTLVACCSPLFSLSVEFSHSFVFFSFPIGCHRCRSQPAWFVLIRLFLFFSFLFFPFAPSSTPHWKFPALPWR